MTRKDYKLIADIIRQQTVNTDSKFGGVIYPADLAAAIASALKHDNPRFRRDLFLKACGIEENPFLLG